MNSILSRSSLPIDMVQTAMRIEGYNKNIVSVQPIGGTGTFVSGDEIIFQLSPNILFDAKQTAVAMDLKIESLPTGSNVYSPTNTHALFQSIDVFVNGVKINTECDPGLYETIRMTFEDDVGGVGKDSLYSFGVRKELDNGTHKLLVKNLPAIFRATKHRYIDTGILGSVELRMRVKDFARSLEKENAGTTYTASIQNVRLLMPLLQFSTGAYRELLASEVSTAGGLDIPYKNVASYLGNSFTGSTQFAVHLAAQSIDRLWAATRLPSATDSNRIVDAWTGGVAYLPSLEYKCESAEDREIRFEINSVAFPQSAIRSLRDQFYNTLTALDTMNEPYKGLMVDDAATYASHQAWLAVSLSHHDKGYSISGLNTYGSSQPIYLTISNAGATALVPLVVAEMTSTLNVKPGKQVAPIF